MWTFDETFAKLLIRHQIGNPIGTSVFQIAWFTSAGNFISHPGFQSCVEEVWKSNLKYSLSALVPILFIPFIAVRQIQQSHKEKSTFWEGLGSFLPVCLNELFFSNHFSANYHFRNVKLRNENDHLRLQLNVFVSF